MKRWSKEQTENGPQRGRVAGIIGQRKPKGGEAVRMKKKPVGVERDQAESDITFNLIKQLFPR